MSEPITSLKCPSCGALVPIFEKASKLKCHACGAEFPVRYVEPATAAGVSEGDLAGLAVAWFVYWLLSRYRK